LDQIIHLQREGPHCKQANLKSPCVAKEVPESNGSHSPFVPVMLQTSLEKCKEYIEPGFITKKHMEQNAKVVHLQLPQY